MNYVKIQAFWLVILLSCSVEVAYGQSNPFSTKSKNQLNYATTKKLGIGIGMDLFGTCSEEKVYEIFGEYAWKRIGVRMGVSYVRRGSKAESLILSNNNRGMPTTLQLTSIEMPLVLCFYPVFPGGCFFGGVEMGYITAGKVHATQKIEYVERLQSHYDYPLDYTLEEMAKKMPLQRFQLGIIGGWRCEIKWGLGLGIYVYTGLIDLIQAEKFDNTHFYLSLNYTMQGKSKNPSP